VSELYIYEIGLVRYK